MALEENQKAKIGQHKSTVCLFELVSGFELDWGAGLSWSLPI